MTFRRIGGRARSLLAVAGLLVVAAGAFCSSSQTVGAEGSATSPAEPQQGGTFTYSVILEPRILDPLEAGYTSAFGTAPYFYALYDVLVMEDPATTEVVPKLAESLTTDDGVVWTLRLRPDVTFSDGTPLDAEAVKFNIERYGDPANNSRNLSTVGEIASMDVVDPLTLDITLVEPNVAFDRVVARSLGYVASPTALQGDPDGFNDAPVGAGPFLLDEWVRGSHMAFTRNPNYWDSPRPYVDELIISLHADEVQRFNAFQTGQTDATTSASNPGLAARAAEAGFDAVELRTTVGGSQLQLNVTQPPFDDVRVRQAIHLAIDKQALVDAMHDGGDAPVEHVIREPSPFFSAEQSLPAPDKAEAQRLIDEYVAENGPVEFTYLHGTGDVAVPEYIQAELLALDGVVVSLEGVQGADYPARMATGDFQMATWVTAGLGPDPDLFFLLQSESARNYTGYSDPEMDLALETGRTSLDVQEQTEAYETVQRLMIRDMPVVWLTTNSLTFPYHDHVHGFSTNGTSPLFEQTWVTQ